MEEIINGLEINVNKQKIKWKQQIIYNLKGLFVQISKKEWANQRKVCRLSPTLSVWASAGGPAGSGLAAVAGKRREKSALAVCSRGSLWAQLELLSIQSSWSVLAHEQWQQTEVQLCRGQGASSSFTITNVRMMLLWQVSTPYRDYKYDLRLNNVPRFMAAWTHNSSIILCLCF